MAAADTMPITKPRTPPHQPCFLAGWRAVAGLSQDELALGIGWAKSTVSAVETGQRPWSQPFLENVVDYLRTHGLPTLTLGDIIDVNPFDTARMEIWALSRRVPDSKREAAADVLRGLTERRQEAFVTRPPRKPTRRRKAS